MCGLLDIGGLFSCVDGDDARYRDRRNGLYSSVRLVECQAVNAVVDPGNTGYLRLLYRF